MNISRKRSHSGHSKSSLVLSRASLKSFTLSSTSNKRSLEMDDETDIECEAYEEENLLDLPKEKVKRKAINGMVELLTLNGKKLLVDLPKRRVSQKEFKILVQEMTGLHGRKYNLVHIANSKSSDASPSVYFSKNKDAGFEITYGTGDNLMMVAMFGTSCDML